MEYLFFILAIILYSFSIYKLYKLKINSSEEFIEPMMIMVLYLILALISVEIMTNILATWIT